MVEHPVIDLVSDLNPGHVDSLGLQCFENVPGMLGHGIAEAF